MGLHDLEALRVCDEFEAAGGSCFEHGGNLASRSIEPAAASVRGSGGKEVLSFHQIYAEACQSAFFFKKSLGW